MSRFRKKRLVRVMVNNLTTFVFQKRVVHDSMVGLIYDFICVNNGLVVVVKCSTINLLEKVDLAKIFVMNPSCLSEFTKLTN